MLDKKAALKLLSIDERAKDKICAIDKANILKDEFWEKISSLYNLLKPIEKWIFFIEGDSPQINLVTCIFKDLEKNFDININKNQILFSNRKFIKKILKDRKDFCVKDVHKAANILDPKNLGKDLSQLEILESLEFINKLSINCVELSVSKVLDDLACYRAKSGIWKKDFLWKCAASTKVCYFHNL